MKIIDENTVHDLISMDESIEAMEWAFVQLSKGNSFVPQRTHLDIPDKNASALIMPAYVLECPFYSVKLVSINYSNPHKGLPLIQAIVQVFDASTGEMIASIDGNSITALRTAAASGLATKYLSKNDASICAIFGTGVQAKAHISAMMSVRDINKFIIVGSSLTSAESFIQSHNIDCQLEIGDVSSIGEADIICTTTPSNQPLFHYKHINKGCHINVIGSHTPDAREVSTQTVIKSKVVVDSLEACQKEAGDLIIPEKDGVWSFDLVNGELGHLVQRDVHGRETDNEITLFKSVGVAIQDLAMAKFIMEKL